MNDSILYITEDFKSKEILNILQSDYQNIFMISTAEEDITPNEYDIIKSNKNFDIIEKNIHCVLGSTEESVKKHKTEFRLYDILGDKTNFYGWPTSMILFTFLAYSGIENHILNKTHTANFTDLYINQTKRGRPHRIELLDKLYKNDLLRFGINTYVPPMSIYDIDYEWRNRITNIDDGQGEISIAYQNHTSLFEIITETFVDRIRYTEKTWKPILNKKPFLILGGVGINNKLKSFGFQLYDEIFDYEFDNYGHPSQRIDGIIENIQNLKNENYNETFKLVENKVNYNFQILLNLFKKDTNINKNFINTLNKQPYDILFEDGYLMKYNSILSYLS